MALFKSRSPLAAAIACMASLAFAAGPASAQIRSVDPDAAIDSDLTSPQSADPVTTSAPLASPVAGELPPVSQNGTPVEPSDTAGMVGAAPAASESTYRKDDLIGAAEGLFGKGAAGLADMIEGLLKEQGEPNGYIVGREAGGAFMFGVRYGSGTLHHKIEGERPVYWTGPSLGFDAGANAANAFILVYNLYDTQDIFHRYGAGEGQAYLVGGFHVSYLRRNNVVLIPVRMGAGLRLGVNVGYLKFSEKQNWLPF